jgi:hypothetical protein
MLAPGFPCRAGKGEHKQPEHLKRQVRVVTEAHCTCSPWTLHLVLSNAAISLTRPAALKAINCQCISMWLGMRHHWEKGLILPFATFSTLQPFGKIPAIEDGDVAIFESRAIIRYLVSLVALLMLCNLTLQAHPSQSLLPNAARHQLLFCNSMYSCITLITCMLFAPAG